MREQRAIESEFAEYFDACAALREFVRKHRPEFRAKDAAELTVLWTVARSYRTFLVVVHLCKCGYAQQAAMLNRTLPLPVAALSSLGAVTPAYATTAITAVTAANTSACLPRRRLARQREHTRTSRLVARSRTSLSRS